MNRIDQKFAELKKLGKKAFIGFLTAGDPSLQLTEKLALEFAQNGVDILEIGIPFSDPLADGPTIQAASQRALKNGMTVEKAFQLAQRIRHQSAIPLIFMTYYNPVFHFGIERFVAEAQKCGVDGLIIPDLPPEEAKDLIKAAKRKNIATIFFLSPTTTPSRMKKMIQASTGFIYYVSLTGVTGARTMLPTNIAANIRLAKKMTTKPICAGFGISTREQIKAINQQADGVIVASVVINEIQKHLGKKDLVSRIGKFVKNLSQS